MAKKVAIIEDDDTISEMYQLKLENEGYEAYVARNGRDGLELIQKSRPNVILLDLMMPEMTGEEMLTEIRKTDWGKDIPVIVLTT